jgi:Fe2+ or Zn2+ uptake regulation protein
MTVEQGASCPQAYGEDHHKPSVGAGSAGLKPSGKGNPCPICSRTKDGDCRIGAELVLCHYGSSHHPPEGLRPGDTHPGGDGQQWAYTKDTSDGRAATFTPHKPLQPAAVAPLTEPPLPRDRPSWRYSATFYIVRKDHAKGGKSFLPLTWVDGTWLWKAPEGNRPMLLSHPLAAKPDATVLIVEGEKTWDAAQKLFPDLIACCWSGGCKAIAKTNFTPLAGRKVALWPDNDDAGRDAMERLAQVLYGVGAASVKVVANPDDAPQGWDLADANWTTSEAAAWVKVNTSETAKTAKGTPPRHGEQEPPPAPLTFEQQWELLELHAAEVACSDWPVMKGIAAMSRKASELDIPRLGQRQIEQLLEQAQRRIRAKDEPVLGGGVFTIKATPWAVEGIFRHGLNLLTGQSGAGKSRLVAACMAAWLRGDQTWLQRKLQGDDPRHRHALIIGTDQNLEDWHLTLGPVGLTTKLSDTEVQVHDRLTIYSLETGIQLDADGLNTIRRWVDAHPGGMVLVDSLAQCLPPGVDEDKSSAARPVHQLQEVLGDAWAILTHHSRKGAGKEGNLGVGAGRGSGAIDAAVSRVVGLGLTYKMENGQMVAQESDPRRELLSTKRGGKTEHLIVSSDASGFWDVHGTAEALKAQERQHRALSNLTEAQSDVLGAVEAGDGWVTPRDVVGHLGEEYESTGSRAALIRKVLKRLEVLGMIESQRVGNERTYRTTLNHPSQREVGLNGSTGSVIAAQGVSLVQQLVQHGSVDAAEPPEQAEPPEPPEPEAEPVAEPVKSTAAQGLNQLNHLPVSDGSATGSEHRQADEQRIRALGPGAADLSGWSDDEVAELRQSLEQVAKRQASGFAIPVQEAA